MMSLPARVALAPRDDVAEDPLLDALVALERVVEENIVRSRLLLRRIRHVRQERAAGRSYRQIAEAETRPGVVELASANLDSLLKAAGRVRRLKAHALYREGMTMDQLASLYGVTRQRISALLKEDPPVAPDAEARPQP